MLQRMLHIGAEDMEVQMDATDALAAAYCHFIQMGAPQSEKKYSSWKDFVKKRGLTPNPSPKGEGSEE